jgi:hypothetical protein
VSGTIFTFPKKIGTEEVKTNGFWVRRAPVFLLDFRRPIVPVSQTPVLEGHRMKAYQVPVAMGALCGLLVAGCSGAGTKPDANLFAQYLSAIKGAVISNWLPPDGLPKTSVRFASNNCLAAKLWGSRWTRAAHMTSEGVALSKTQSSVLGSCHTKASKRYFALI